MTPDFGPFYTETNWDNFIREPWNAATATLFFWLALFWILKLRGRAKDHVFSLACLGLLLIGGIGGTLFHAFRSSRFFLVMDFLPIILTTVAVTTWLWKRALGSYVPAAAIVLGFFGLQRAARLLFAHSLAITASYALTGVFILIPLLLNLKKDQWKQAKPIFAAAALFVVALFFRAADLNSDEWIPWGTHWLWHLFSVAAVYLLIDYVTQLEAKPSPDRATKSPSPARRARRSRS